MDSTRATTQRNDPANPSRFPSLPSGFLDFRIYGVTPEGVKYSLPPDVWPKPGVCLVPGCSCGGPEAEAT